MVEKQMRKIAKCFAKTTIEEKAENKRTNKSPDCQHRFCKRAGEVLRLKLFAIFEVRFFD